MDELHSSAAIKAVTFSNVTRDLEDEQAIMDAIPVITNSLDGGWFGKISTTVILLFGTFSNGMTETSVRLVSDERLPDRPGPVGHRHVVQRSSAHVGTEGSGL